MIPALRDFLRSLVEPPPPGEAPVSIELATAVLLVEAMRADRGTQSAERDAVAQILQQRFSIDDGDLHDLLAAAEDRSRRSNDFFSFTSVLNDRLTQPQKIEIVELMWRVAYVDGHADAGESHIISKIAGLLHVTHGEYIAAKMHAKQGR
ncbi:MAG TPA: TerB family tellurite resistance protein [Ramlibacter sp.]|uniref:tellurite resistance TerB family protein n=1 Tax=Ramlibacter sp. TaxID=1917967 RepID=UPI002D7EAA0B|nr:TerB family tellurite resistance protein [Ramlibacter sp.]HET8746133.1 TerB family tellurite resistance protein [Ramlibacter sp.]